MAILLIAEHDNATPFGPDRQDAVGRAEDRLRRPRPGRRQGRQGCRRRRRQAAGRRPRCCSPKRDELAERLAEPTAALIVSLAGGYDTIIAPATSSGKNIMPRVAALLDVMQISEIVEVVSADTFKRPIYAGNAIQTVQSTDAKKVITVRTASFQAAAEGGSAAGRDASRPPPIPACRPSSRTGCRKATVRNSPRPRSSSPAAARSARRRSSRKSSCRSPTSSAPPSAHRAPPSTPATRRTTGRSARPARSSRRELYIAVGISGAIQHLAGMKDSKVIVAINKDEEAPIFQVADYGLVGDLFTILPELEKAL